MTQATQAAFLPFTRPHLDAEAIAAVSAVLESGWITSGPRVAEFEATLSTLFGGRRVVSFANGTATLEVGLRVAGVGPGDEVITTPISWAATANVILNVGATPVFADIDPHTRNLDLAKVEAAITERTRAIMPVYIAGLPMDMDALYDLARRHKLRVVEDAAQAIDSRWDDKRIGALGDLVSFSFQANKNVTCVEGGCLVVNNADEARVAELYRLQGVVRTGADGMDVLLPGGKFNLTDVNAAIGLRQLKQLDDITAQRTALARHYFDTFRALGIEALGVVLPPDLPAGRARTNWHMFQVELPADRLQGGRAGVMDAMKALGVGCGVHYPAIHLFSLYRERGFTDGMFPVAERIGRGILTLPLFYDMSTGDVERVCHALLDTCKRLLTR
jgi:dTDP-4-amino-4,6-dideoxygalactose transaminase